MSIRSLPGHLGVRARLMVLIALAMLPLAALIAFGIADGMHATFQQARHDLRRTAELAADAQATIFDNARSVLEASRIDPAVSVRGGEACEAALRSLLAGNPQFLTMGVIDREGTIVCHSKLRKRQAFSDVKLAARVLTPGTPDLVVGNFMIGKVTGKPTVAIAMALPSGDAIAFVSLDLERMASKAKVASDRGSLAVTMIQPDPGRMLTHYPPIVAAFGSPLDDSALVAAMRANPGGGGVEAAGPDGVVRLYGFAPVRGAETAGMMLAVGKEEAAIIGAARKTMVAAVVLGGCVFLLALASTWWMGRATQLAPLERLSRFTTDIDSGNGGARIRMEAWQAPELRCLAGRLNATSVRLDEARHADDLIAASESRFRLLAENTADLVTSLDASGRRTFVSPASRDMLGREPEELLGRHPAEIAHPDDVPTVDAMMASLRSGSAIGDVRYRMAHRNGHYVWVEVSGRPLVDGTGMMMSIRDVTRRRAMETELERVNLALSELATTDGLTGLLNRRGFDTTLEREVARCRRERVALALLFIDVDRFKAFNDTYGHIKGDDCLRRVSDTVLAEIRRPGDSASRYGGEEIAVILPGASDAGALERAQAIVGAVRNMGIPNSGSEHQVVTVSVGVAVMSAKAETDGAELVDRSDRALYAAKSSGRDRVVAWRLDIAA